ncbi:MAG TPA: DUF4097 family beta strand repeat-containing protein [Streptosporangiaceae bacterium]|jgi:DUF4097 and DUF4098 domain-containing protein YvlB
MPHWDFPGSDPIDVSIDLASGRVTMDAGPVSATTVDVAPSRFSRNAEKLIDEFRVTFDHGRLEVAGPRRTGLFRGNAAFDVTITLPEGSRCRARTASADITCSGELAELEAHAASGDITAARVTGQLQAETSSGDIRLDETGTAEIRSVSGDVRLTWARDDVSVRTASGDVTIANAAAAVAGTTASGDFRVASVARDSTKVSTASGDVIIGVNPGVGVYLDLSSATGSVTSQLDETGPSEDVALRVRCRTVSGDIRIIRAAAAGPARARDDAPGAIEPTPAE